MKRALALLLAVLALPAAAHGATVRVADASDVTHFGYGSDYDSQRLIYEAAPGETNRLVVALGDFTSVTVSDSGATIEAGRGCERIDAHSARCSTLRPEEPYLASAEARLGDGDDEVRRATGEDFGRIVALGGPGND